MDTLQQLVGTADCEKTMGPRQLGLIESLQVTETALATKLNDVQVALKALRDHPEIAETLELIRRATRY